MTDPYVGWIIEKIEQYGEGITVDRETDLARSAMSGMIGKGFGVSDDDDGREITMEMAQLAKDFIKTARRFEKTRLYCMTHYIKKERGRRIHRFQCKL